MADLDILSKCVIFVLISVEPFIVCAIFVCVFFVCAILGCAFTVQHHCNSTLDISTESVYIVQGKMGTDLDISRDFMQVFLVPPRQYDTADTRTMGR